MSTLQFNQNYHSVASFRSCLGNSFTLVKCDRHENDSVLRSVQSYYCSRVITAKVRWLTVIIITRTCFGRRVRAKEINIQRQVSDPCYIIKGGILFYPP